MHGWPQFDGQGFYLGPLAKPKAELELIGKETNELFATQLAGDWPCQLCKVIADLVWQNFENGRRILKNEFTYLLRNQSEKYMTSANVVKLLDKK